MAASLLVTILVVMLLLLALPLVTAVLGLFLPPPATRVVQAINLLLMLAVVLRLLIAVYQYAVLLWRLKAHVARRA